jgi:hypothetical protein
MKEGKRVAKRKCDEPCLSILTSKSWHTSARANSSLARIDSNSPRLFASHDFDGTLSALKKERSSCHFHQRNKVYLNYVAVVVKDDDDRLKALAEHGGDVLDGELAAWW